MHIDDETSGAEQSESQESNLEDVVDQHLIDRHKDEFDNILRQLSNKFDYIATKEEIVADWQALPKDERGRAHPDDYKLFLSKHPYENLEYNLKLHYKNVNVVLDELESLKRLGIPSSKTFEEGRETAREGFQTLIKIAKEVDRGDRRSVSYVDRIETLFRNMHKFLADAPIPLESSQEDYDAQMDFANARYSIVKKEEEEPHFEEDDVPLDLVPRARSNNHIMIFGDLEGHKNWNEILLQSVLRRYELACVGGLFGQDWVNNNRIADQAIVVGATVLRGPWEHAMYRRLEGMRDQEKDRHPEIEAFELMASQNELKRSETRGVNRLQFVHGLPESVLLEGSKTAPDNRAIFFYANPNSMEDYFSGKSQTMFENLDGGGITVNPDIYESIFHQLVRLEARIAFVGRADTPIVWDSDENEYFGEALRKGVELKPGKKYIASPGKAKLGHVLLYEGDMVRSYQFPESELEGVLETREIAGEYYKRFYARQEIELERRIHEYERKKTQNEEQDL